MDVTLLQHGLAMAGTENKPLQSALLPPIRILCGPFVYEAIIKKEGYQGAQSDARSEAHTTILSTILLSDESFLKAALS